MSEDAPRLAAARTIAIFLALTFALTGSFQALSLCFGMRGLLLVTAAMWSPAIAALLTCVIIGRPIASLPWGWGPWRWNIAAWLLPLLYCLVAYGLVWALGLGGVPDPATIARWSEELGLTGAADGLVVLAALLLIGVFGIIDKLSRALGEEIGWRGFLVFELRKLMPFWAVGLVSGAIWAVWHYPWILGASYNSGESRALSLALFTIGMLAAGIVYAYLSFKSRSLWPAAILHASHNLFVQRVFTPLTRSDEDTALWIDEFGIMLPAVMTVIAIGVLLRARREQL